MFLADAAPTGAGLGIVAAILLGIFALFIFVVWMVIRAIRIRMRDDS